MRQKSHAGLCAMPEFTRQELYDLVWSEPIKTLAARFDISDVGLAKTCHKENVPVPEGGHWAKGNWRA
jgi:hypothetical protein